MCSDTATAMAVGRVQCLFGDRNVVLKWVIGSWRFGFSKLAPEAQFELPLGSL